MSRRNPDEGRNNAPASPGFYGEHKHAKPVTGRSGRSMKQILSDIFGGSTPANGADDRPFPTVKDGWGK